MKSEIRVTVWGENIQEQTSENVRAIYPRGIHQTIADALSTVPGISARCAVLQEPEHGLSETRLAETDVLTWWGHKAHAEVSDAVVERVAARVWEGMGLLVLHSGHYSKLFKKLMGTSCSLSWRVAGERERLWVCSPGHPIAAGLNRYFELPQSEMYGEPFSIPAPDDIVFISWFAGGEVFRSGCTWRRGAGRIFFFGPGHEIYPIYHDANVQRVIVNGVRWACARGEPWVDACARVEPVEKLSPG
ncbi:MAG TPA: ThuA domain-containing protein [Chthoniobacteraceae bacterium]|nr:ThuA domain-containing protein [Chthoniobacteraceae bacterium]